MDREHEIAVRESHAENAVDAYFNARPQIESLDRRNVYLAGHKQGWEDRAEVERLAAQAAQPSGVWRCFHCDEVFSNKEDAATHFGNSIYQQPGCQIDVSEYRKMEELHRRACEEDLDSHRAIHGIQAAHREALEREEIKGYERGLRDSKLCPCAQAAPIDMVLYCPACGMQHVDAADPPITVLEATLRAHPLAIPAPQRWDNPPHRSHLCHGCGHIWRPADVPTNGVQQIKTRGSADSVAAPQAAQEQAPTSGQAVRMLTEEDVNNACLTYRHDFGLMDSDQQMILKSVCRLWWSAICKAQAGRTIPADGEI